MRNWIEWLGAYVIDPNFPNFRRNRSEGSAPQIAKMEPTCDLCPLHTADAESDATKLSSCVVSAV